MKNKNLFRATGTGFFIFKLNFLIVKIPAYTKFQ